MSLEGYIRLNGSGAFSGWWGSTNEQCAKNGRSRFLRAKSSVRSTMNDEGCSSMGMRDSRKSFAKSVNTRSLFGSTPYFAPRFRQPQLSPSAYGTCSGEAAASQSRYSPHRKSSAPAASSNP